MMLVFTACWFPGTFIAARGGDLLVSSSVDAHCFKLKHNGTGVGLSGGGKLWQYYHFLVDFAAPMVYRLGHSEGPKVLHLPDFYMVRRARPSPDTWRFEPRRDPGRSLTAHADFLFSPLGLRVNLVDSLAAYQSLR